MGGAFGSCHILDVPLVFGNFGAGLALLLMGDTPPPEAAALSRPMRTAWTSFAADGDPGWPAVDFEQPALGWGVGAEWTVHATSSNRCLSEDRIVDTESVRL
jgi:para-nitrobenzyl esterase